MIDLTTIPTGTRVVVRYRLDDGRATDAVGYLQRCDATELVVESKRGTVTVTVADIIAAKVVPEPPAPRHSTR